MDGWTLTLGCGAMENDDGKTNARGKVTQDGVRVLGFSGSVFFVCIVFLFQAGIIVTDMCSNFDKF